MIKVFAVLLSFQLIVAPVSLAQTAGDQYRANPDAKAGGGFDYMGIMKGMAMGAIGTSVVACKNFMRLPSMMIFLAGSLAYIANEMSAAKGQSDFLKRKAEDIKMLEEKMKDSSGGAGENQRETLKLALEDEEALLKNAEKRLKGVKTVSTIFTAAVALAVIEAILSMPPMKIFPTSAGCGAGNLALSKTVGIGLAGAYAASGVLGGDMMGGALSGAASFGGYYLTANTAVGGMVNKLLDKSITRAAGFMVAKMIFDSSKGKLTGVRDQLKENVEKLKSVLATFDQNTVANNSTVTGPDSGVDGAPGQSTSGALGGTGADALGRPRSTSTGGTNDISPLANVSSDPSRNCWRQTDTGPVYSTDCTNPLAVGRPTFDASINVPTLRNASNSAVDYAQAIAKGDTAGADAASANLESLATKLDGVKDEMVGKLNKALASQGKPTIDLDKEASDINSQMNSSLQGAFSKDSSALAALSRLDNFGSSSNTDSEDSKDDSSVITAAVAPSVDLNAKKGIGSDFSISEGGSGLLNESSALSEGDLSAAKGLEESLGEYETSVNDISNRSEDSIFKQVSMRYQANYDRFFERKKPQPESGN